MAINEANVGYLLAIVMKEILSGRTCEITGGVCVDIKTMEDYRRNRERLAGRFGEIIQWTPGKKALIATRNPPKWAAELFEKVVWDAPIMARWEETRDKI
jgi:hypothetical protein